jgi:hypothetical protein
MADDANATDSLSQPPASRPKIISIERNCGGYVKSKGARFFNIDRRIWWAVCVTGKISVPVAYLTIANGTGRDNKTSKWSAKSC